jgi:hypothetical protein
MTIAYPTVGGLRVSYSSITADFGGLFQLGIVDISYQDSLEPGEAKGTSPQVLATTLGDYKASGSVTFLRAEFDAYIAAVAKRSRTNSYMDVTEDVTVSYQVRESDPVSTDELIGVRVKLADHTNSQGADPTKVKCDLHIIGIIKNGILPFAGFRR